VARPIDEFVAAWAALSGRDTGERGWRGIPVASAGSSSLLAARRFPGNEEALLARFPSSRLAPSEHLPEGRGFEIVKADPNGDGKMWLALSRRESGSADLFAEMVGDVAGAMDAAAPEGEEMVLKAMLRRVRMWQAFMGKGAMPLGPEAEVGLAGEISFLSALLDAGVGAAVALEAWVGPDDAAQDFALGEGAVEVKATVSTAGFPAKIGSLEQLDDAVLSPLFLAGVRFTVAESGTSLPERVAEMERRLSATAFAASAFRERTFAAGYSDSHAAKYTRRFLDNECHVLVVADGFPRLVRGNVPQGVSKARYEIDLGRSSAYRTDLHTALQQLGVI
jgi:hypothetical protein